ncbi:16S rRNA (cytosine(1402)-N(4))-methyltransferase RsmH [Ostreibacterium oceani]|uniref:Ribosomal RNA small subunit methyltransferase H n=1 Tax=Ostreibacterium oceani TaxID=2654998 RepID=A0A6N7EXE7_9GAMM|nr:16S rRNA (cytosine(1402)-N(4))-methyltransferase RsmH [Ostreibacterium oceani]MPV86265.1 16S rRNA (cytosine(1402)-N(4))-methyltransferase RsmH [Ostreibacterium oceani]
MSEHVSVLLDASLTALAIQPDGVYLDATFGRGGHSQGILSQLGQEGKLYAVDRDPAAIKTATKITDTRFCFASGNFSEFMTLFPGLGKNSLDGVLLDLGVSSPQLDEASRGFSFTRDGELDMRMNPETGITAKEFVNNATYGDLANVIACMGEERFAKQIAKKIIKARTSSLIATTTQLAEIVKSAIPVRFHTPGRHPATRTFQAIRIYVNRELEELEAVLHQAYLALKKGGRLVVIAFHSLEDKAVKQFVKSLAGNELPPEIPVFSSAEFNKVRLIGRPVRPSEAEIAQNPRARSSIMRVIEKL